MRVLVCGGRDFNDWGRVMEVLDNIHIDKKIDTIIEGGASGADTLAWKWAKNRLGKGNSISFEAEWDKHGKSAGPMRNQRMIDEGKPDIVVAFPGGRGTQDMIRRAVRAGIKVIKP